MCWSCSWNVIQRCHSCKVHHRRWGIWRARWDSSHQVGMISPMGQGHQKENPKSLSLVQRVGDNTKPVRKLRRSSEKMCWPGAGAALTAVPTTREKTIPPHLFRVVLLRRLCLDLPFSVRSCRCGRLQETCGRQLAERPMRRRAEQAWRLRWRAMFACAAARPVAATMLDMLHCQGGDGNTPNTFEVEGDHRYDGLASWVSFVSLFVLSLWRELRSLLKFGKRKDTPTPGLDTTWTTPTWTALLFLGPAPPRFFGLKHTKSPWDLLWPMSNKIRLAWIDTAEVESGQSRTGPNQDDMLAEVELAWIEGARASQENQISKKMGTQARRKKWCTMLPH